MIEVRKAQPVGLTPAASTSEAFLAITDECIAHWRANVHGVLVAREMDSLHQTRVGIRRFRSALSLFNAVIDDPQLPWLSAEIRALALPLGEARDLDVFLAGESGAALAPADRALLEKRRSAAYDAVIVVLTSQRWADIWALVDRFRSHAPWHLDPDRPAVEVAAEILDRRWARLLRDGMRLVDLDAPQRHRVRIRAKKIRYGAQFFDGLFPEPTGTPPSEFAQTLGELQDALGLLNDAHTQGLLLDTLGLASAPIDEDAMVDEAVVVMARVAALVPFWRATQRPASSGPSTTPEGAR